MAVKFRKDGYVIEIKTVTNPVEDWLVLVDEILTLISLVDERCGHHPWKAAGFLREMMPEYDDAKVLAQH